MRKGAIANKLVEKGVRLGQLKLEELQKIASKEDWYGVSGYSLSKLVKFLGSPPPDAKKNKDVSTPKKQKTSDYKADLKRAEEQGNLVRRAGRRRDEGGGRETSEWLEWHGAKGMRSMGLPNDRLPNRMLRDASATWQQCCCSSSSRATQTATIVHTSFLSLIWCCFPIPSPCRPCRNAPER